MGMAIENLKHTKIYKASIRKPSSFMESMVGYTIIKLNEDFEYTVYGNEYVAKRGAYLAQCNFGRNGQVDYPAPVVRETWKEITNEFHVYKNKNTKLLEEL